MQSLKPTWITERSERTAARSSETKLRAAQEQVAEQALAAGALPYWRDFLQSLQTNVLALSELDVRAILTTVPTLPKAPQLSRLTVFGPSPFVRQESLMLEFREREAYIEVRGPVRDLVRLSYDPSTRKVVGLGDGNLNASELADSLVRELVELVNPER